VLKCYRLFFALSLMAIFNFGATAAQAQLQNQPKSSDYISDAGLTAEDLVQRMLAGNLELQAARQRLIQAEARLDQAELRPNPNIEFQEKTDRIISNRGNRERELTVKQPLELFGRRSSRIEAARLEIERIRYEVADLERQRRADLEALIGQALSEAAHLHALEQIGQLNEDLRGATILRVRAGDASRYELAQIEVETAKLQTDRLRIASHLDGLMLEIKSLVGMSLTDALLLRPLQLEPGGELLSLDEALSTALQLRPDLKVARLAEQEAEAKIKLAEAAATPDIGVILGFKRPSTVSPAPVHSSDWQFKIGFSVTLPVFNRNQGLVREGVATLSEARLRRQNLEQLIRRDVMMAARRLEQAQRELKLYEEALRLARGSIQMARLGFEQGELRLVDYVIEQRRLIDLEDAYAQSRNEFFQARAQFRRALGK
jgi:cobalt-zinc-cadmium efflux system outer membrane protein